MKIIVLGDGGQLGKSVKNAFGTMKTAIGHLDVAYKAAKVFYFDSKTGDITNGKLIDLAVSEIRPNIIINCAAFTDVDGCERQQNKAMRINANGAKNVAIAAQKAKAKIIHISTDYVFSGESIKPYCEWDMPDPKTIYGKSKLLGEQYVRDFSEKFFILRTSWLYSSYGKNFLKTIINLGKEKKELHIINDQLGNPTNAEDLVHHLLELALTEEYGLYHCSGKGVTSWYEFAKAIIYRAGLQTEVIPTSSRDYPSVASRPKYSALENLSLENTIGDNMRRWDEAFEEVVFKI